MRVVDAELISIDAVTALAQGGDGDDKATAEEMKLKDTEAECLARLQAQQVLAGFCLTTQHLPGGGGGGRFPPQPPPPPPEPDPLGKTSLLPESGAALFHFLWRWICACSLPCGSYPLPRALAPRTHTLRSCGVGGGARAVEQCRTAEGRGGGGL